MLEQATQDNQKELLDYLAKDAENCLYLYLDIRQYGIGSDTISVWYTKEGQRFTLIALQYFDCLQVYSHDNDFEVADLISLVDTTGVNKVRGTRTCIESIESSLSQKFDSEYGAVIEKVKARDFGTLFERVQEAELNDIPEIIDLLFMEERNKMIYSREGLTKSLSNLIKTHTGHVFLIREDGKIVASETISAESDLFLIGAHLITHPEYRHLLYGSVIESYVHFHVKGDRRVFTFVVEPRRCRMLTAQGNQVIGEYGKLVNRGTCGDRMR